jgi:hypothetical protein
MTQPAQLITPDGKKINLSHEQYRQMKGLLDARQRRQATRSRARMKAAIQAGYGMVAGKGSLTAALLEERAKERAREDAKLDWFKN